MTRKDLLTYVWHIIAILLITAVLVYVLGALATFSAVPRGQAAPTILIPPVIITATPGWRPSATPTEAPVTFIPPTSQPLHTPTPHGGPGPTVVPPPTVSHPTVTPGGPEPTIVPPPTQVHPTATPTATDVPLVCPVKWSPELGTYTVQCFQVYFPLLVQPVEVDRGR